MPNKTDQVVSLITDVVGAVNDVENTLQTSQSHEKKAAAMTALQDAINIATKSTPGSNPAQVKDVTGKAVDLAVELKNVLGIFKKSKHHKVPAKKTA